MRVSFLIGSSRRTRVRSREARESGFTLIEMLVSVVILAIMVGLIFTIGNQANQAWTSSNRRIEQFSAARTAFEVLSRTLGQVTLNTYYDYYNSGGLSHADAIKGGATSFIPASFGRTSDLEFVSGTTLATGLTSSLTATTAYYPPNQISHAVFFAAPLSYTTTALTYGNLDNLLCACGFYVQYSRPSPAAPAFFTGPGANYYRFRLMEVVVPTENFPMYKSTGIWATSNAWISGMTGGSAGTDLGTTSVHQIASNIVALIVSPEDPSNTATPYYIAPTYDYDSRRNLAITQTVVNGAKITFAQAPPILHIAMVAIDEQSAVRMGNTPGQPDIFTGAPFTDASKFQADLTQLQANLNATPANQSTNKIPLNCRVFETRVALRESKWSTK